MRRKPAGARFARIDAPATETIRLSIVTAVSQ